ncbi:MAG: thermopsin family protease [Thermoplasmata archaeon]
MPLYATDPAPMGLSYNGATGDGHGSYTSTALDTTGVEGLVDANATGIRGADLYQSVPDSFSIQLNAVLTDVTLRGDGTSFTFWAQDVVTYFPATEYMIMVTNVWNFSAPDVPVKANSILDHGPQGTTKVDQLGYYYANESIGFPVAYPFDLSLFMTSNITDGRDSVFFYTDLTSTAHPSEDFTHSPWDYVVFNSESAADPVPVSSAATFTASSVEPGYNAAGLVDDFELLVCGPGGGSQVDLSTADATLGLGYLAGGLFHSVPAALSYGEDSGETATGANVAWSNQSGGGPAGVLDYGTMTTGPSILTGLWGFNAPGGSYAITLNVNPANAFNFFLYSGTAVFSAPIAPGYEYAPNMRTHTFYLMPGTYRLRTELADHTVQNTVTTVISSPETIGISLGLSTTLGVYTPLWAFSAPEVADLAQSGTGVLSNPYVLYNHQLGPLSPLFGLYNDYAFPVFPGVFLWEANASVLLVDPPNFSAATNDSQSPGPLLPQLNDLQYWFWGDQAVGVVNATDISGWFALSAYLPIAYNSFNVVAYESVDVLIGDDYFATEGQGLVMYTSGSPFGPAGGVGGSNTVWGNEFVEVGPPTTCLNASVCLPLLPYASGLGVEIAEPHDTIYNNIFATPTTAWLLPLNLYSGLPETFTQVLWNITPQAASDVHFAAGFPEYPLSGSIVGGLTQGGNSWWDYGVNLNWANGADNPMGALPYDENARTLLDPLPGYGTPLPGYGCTLIPPGPYYCATYINPGGDFRPLKTVYETVSSHETNLPLGTSWGTQYCGPIHFPGGGGTRGCSGAEPDLVAPATGATYGIHQVSVVAATPTLHAILPAGDFSWGPVVPRGFTSSSGGTFKVVANHTISTTVSFHVAAGYAILKLHETGLPKGTSWGVRLGGTTTATDAFNTTLVLTTPSGKVLLLDGTYTYSVRPTPGYTPVPSFGSLALTGPASLLFKFHVTSYPVSFIESGLASGKRWSVLIAGPIRGSGNESERRSTETATVQFYLPNGTYHYWVLPPAGWNCLGVLPFPSASVPAHCFASVVSVAGSSQNISLTFSDPLAPHALAEGPAPDRLAVRQDGPFPPLPSLRDPVGAAARETTG